MVLRTIVTLAERPLSVIRQQAVNALLRHLDRISSMLSGKE
jgi:hypothetical protein